MATFEQLFGSDENFLDEIHADVYPDFLEFRQQHKENPEVVREIISRGFQKMLFELAVLGQEMVTTSDFLQKQLYYVQKLLKKSPFTQEEQEDFLFLLYVRGREE